MSRRDLVIARLTLVLAGLLVYGPLFLGQWLWNDGAVWPEMTLGEAWTRPEMAHGPLAASVQWILRQTVAASAFDFHLAAWALNMMAVFLLWRVLEAIGVKWAFFGALVFLVHPLTVESVAWIPDLGNVLALPLMLGAFLAFLREGERDRRSVWPAVMFMGAAFSSDQVLMFPMVLLLYLWWQDGRVSRAGWMKIIPFCVVSVAAGAWMTWQGSGLPFASVAMGPKLVTAWAALVFFVEKSFLPTELAPIYPGWFASYLWMGSVSAVLLVVVGWSWWRRASWGRHVLLGLGYFFLMLLPALNVALLPFTPQLGWVSDQQVYVALVGWAGLLAGGAGWLRARARGVTRGLLVPLAVALVVALLVSSRGYARVFESEERLWAYTLGRNPNAWIAHNRSAKASLDAGKLDAAILHLGETVRLRPDIPELHYNYAVVLEDAEQYASAASEYGRAVRLAPDVPQYATRMARLLVRMGRYHEAVFVYDELLTKDPRNAQWICNRGVALYHLGRRTEAVWAFEMALSIDPTLTDAAENLRQAVQTRSDPPKAQIDPGRPPAEIFDFSTPIRLFPPEGG